MNRIPVRTIPGATRPTRVAVAVAMALLPWLGGGAQAADARLSPYRLDAGASARAGAPEPYQADTGYRLPASEPQPLPPLAPAPAPARPFENEVSAAANEAGVEPALVHAVIEVESAYRPGAISPKGAVGLMQVLPGTAQRYGVTNLASVPDNLRAGSRHLRTLLDMFGHRLDLVLAAYNAGEGAVRRYNNTIPPYRETRDYVPAVLKRYKPLPPAVPVLKSSDRREYLPGTRLESAQQWRLGEYLPGTRLSVEALD